MNVQTTRKINFYHLISLNTRSPILPSCPCFQHSIMRITTASSLLYCMKIRKKNASIFWSVLKLSINMNNIQPAIFQNIFLCYVYYMNNIMQLNNKDI